VSDYGDNIWGDEYHDDGVLIGGARTEAHDGQPLERRFPAAG
jgi:hypothetical protein